MKITKISLIIGLVFLTFGVSLILYIFSSQAVSASDIIQPPAYQLTPMQSNTSEISGMPNELLIPSLKFDLTVIPGYYNAKSQTWNVTLNEAQYATITPEPNDLGGDTFFYGHYRPEVFAYLHTIKSGAQAIVKTTNGHTFFYQLSSIKTTTPYDDSVFTYKGPPILTIQTCTGLFFQDRQFYTFNLMKVV
jgi:sortase (surface protein transpeptidase)